MTSPTRTTQPTRILIVGGGGREHALTWKLAAEPGVNEVVVAPGSDAIAREPRVRRAIVDPLDAEDVVRVARERSVELAVIGPEAPLAAGVADALRAAGIPTVGPGAAAAQIETSKAFCHEIAAAADVAMARSAAFGSANAAEARAWALAEVDRHGSLGVVVKADGLAAGKGVAVCGTADDALVAINELVTRGDRFVVEERLTGPEASVIVVSDGGDGMIAFPAARDHKRLLDGDHGPNTGGMGAYSPLPDLSEDELDAIVDGVHRPILRELQRRGTPFRGFLYAGLMLTPEGPRLLECNARLGDPEAQALLPQLAVPLGPILLAAARGSLGSGWGARFPTFPGSAVGVVLASAGYPGLPAATERIDGIDRAEATGATVFHAATRAVDGGWETAGGRVLTIVARGADLASASEAADRAAAEISWPGMQRRRDIGTDVPLGVAAGAPA
jgi:phosphoribosylamine--glycine ligase